MTFKSIGMIIEMRDGTLQEVRLPDFIRFMIFFPTFSSGPIDRFRRFQEDYHKLPERDDYFAMLNKAVMYLMLGFLYKHIISYCLGGILLPLLENKALMVGGYFNKETILVMYVYGLNLFLTLLVIRCLRLVFPTYWVFEHQKTLTCLSYLQV